MRPALLLSLIFTVVFSFGVDLLALPQEKPTLSNQNQNDQSPLAQTPALSDFGDLPLYFIENQGQMDPEVEFCVQGSDKTLYFTSKGITYSLFSNEEQRQRWIVNLEFVNASPHLKLQGQEQQQARISYFKGKKENWQTGVATFSKLVYQDLWPGIDLVYSCQVDQLKYEFQVKPGADPQLIQFIYRGADTVVIEKNGDLTLHTPLGSITDSKPVGYQWIDGKQSEVGMDFALQETASAGAVVCGFAIDPYDLSKPLVIDPIVFLYSGFIGGSHEYDYLHTLQVDSQGNVYVGGWTQSPQLSFPVTAGPDLIYNGGFSDAWVAKVNAQGTALIYCGYLGGEEGEDVLDLAVDNLGNVYVTGHTTSTESSFPVVGGLDQTFNSPDGYYDAFVAKINSTGTALEYCGYIGGIGNDYGNGIVVDAEGNAYVAGKTQSSESSFPVTVGPYLTLSGSDDAFVAKVHTGGTGLDYCGYIGGADSDEARDIAIDSQKNVYLTGRVQSTEATFPATVGPCLTFGGYNDAFVAKVNAQGTALVYCGFIGGGTYDCGYSIALDDQDNAYVVGFAQSSQNSGFPVLVGPDLTYNSGPFGSSDGFVAKVNAQGTALVYCGYIGGYGNDKIGDVVVDSQGNAYVAGWTDADETTFPVVVGPDLTQNGSSDGFVAKVSTTGRTLEYCGFIGGANGDGCAAIALDDQGSVYLGGSGGSDFPVSIGPDLTFNGGTRDAFVAKLSMALTSEQTELSVAGGSVEFALHGGGTNSGRVYLLLGSTTGTEPGIPLPGGLETLPLNWDGFTNTILNRLNQPLFSNFMGVLDGFGNGQASLNATSVNPAKIGKIMHFAFLLEGPPWDFVSNTVAVEFVP